MRSETEMLDLLVGVALADTRIRAVYMQGSRTNRRVQKDLLQDYDIVYVVQETKSFYQNPAWIDTFGERLYMQCPDAVDYHLGCSVDFASRYGYLLQLADGNRLDLQLLVIEAACSLYDSLSVPLLDKDGILPKHSEPSDVDYWIKQPTQDEFQARCNEFWWSFNGIAKALWREQIPAAHTLLYTVSHPQLITLLKWKICHETDFQISTGKGARYLQNHLSPALWKRVLQTYSRGEINDMWRAAFAMCDLFHATADTLKEQHGYKYDTKEAKASYRFLVQVQQLPRDATPLFVL